MAHVVAKRNGTWEIRESRRTAAGPRSKTLVSFRALTPEVAERAAARASTRLDPEDLLYLARMAGAPVEARPVDKYAAGLLRELTLGNAPRPALRSLLADSIPREEEGPSHEAERMKMWAGASDADRGRALIDLLGLGDALPPKRHGRASGFPRIDSLR